MYFRQNNLSYKHVEIELQKKQNTALTAQQAGHTTYLVTFLLIQLPSTPFKINSSGQQSH